MMGGEGFRWSFSLVKESSHGVSKEFFLVSRRKEVVASFRHSLRMKGKAIAGATVDRDELLEWYIATSKQEQTTRC